jgi:NAD-dependent deacetylase
MHEPTSNFPDDFLSRLSSESRVGVLTGAGISAASGIPTFRGKEGLWKQYRAEELATPQAFADDPTTVWEWYGWRRDLIREAQPNAAHYALAQLAWHVKRLTIITQNVDGLHQRTEMPDHAEVIELHGNIWTMRCTRCGHEREDLTPGPYPDALPTCECGGMERPGVVWFGEMLPNEAIERAHQTATNCDAFLVVGTSSVVHPAAGLSQVAIYSRAYVAEFNLEATPASGSVHLAVQGPCEETLPDLVDRLGRASSP